MHIEHKAGDKMYVDFAGDTYTITDPQNNTTIDYQVFVAVLGGSQKAYIEAVATQTKADWIQMNENALRFFGGVPKAIVPDCLKSAVIKSDKYEPIINETFLDFGRHYGTTILPARALHPKDKPLVESFVSMAYHRIYAPLRKQTFYSLAELNAAFWKQLDLHNNLPFQQRDYSRQSIFESIERKVLGPLPVARYEYKEYCSSMVQYNHYTYLKEDKHYYSVPFQYTGKKVLMCYSSHLVEIYFNNVRIAMHHRDRTLYGYSMIDEHRPADHKYIAEWSAERYINWGKSIGPEVQEVIEKVLDSSTHSEQAFRICMGILSQAKKHSNENLQRACKKAIEVGCLSSKFIANTIKNRTFELSADEELQQLKIPFHENIRGKEWYN
jgi:hypothetical protein